MEPEEPGVSLWFFFKEPKSPSQREWLIFRGVTLELVSAVQCAERLVWSIVGMVLPMIPSWFYHGPVHDRRPIRGLTHGPAHGSFCGPSQGPIMSHLVHLLVTTIGPIHGPAHALLVVLSISPAHHLSYPPSYP